MATLETITSASTPTLKPVKYVTEGYNSIKFVGVATYREFLEDVKETSGIVIEVSLLKSNYFYNLFSYKTDIGLVSICFFFIRLRSSIFTYSVTN